MAQEKFWLNNKVMLAVVLGGFALAFFALLNRSPEWRTAIAKWIQPAAEAPPVDPHAGHDHGAHGDGPHLESIDISETGLKNIGYKEIIIATDKFEKKLTLPATVIERPGYSQIQIPAPMTGIVTKIYQIEGAAIKPGSPLFDMRLTHEELVAAQRDYLRSAENIDVINREIKRLESVGEGTLAGKRILEQQYEKQKLEATFVAERQALLLHGLSEKQIKTILDKRELLKTLTVSAPELDNKQSQSAEETFHLQDLSVKLGQQVESGQSLAILANHATLYLEGRAFENDIPNLRKALAAGWKVTARPNGTSDDSELIKDLDLLYLADHIDAETRAFTFYLSLPNTIVSEREANGSRFIQWKYRPGQRMELFVPIEQWEDKIVLPVDAVVTEGAENFIFVPNGKSFVRTPVHVEYRDLQNVVIENDGSVFPGTAVAGKGAYQMHLAIKNKAGGGIDPHAGHNH
jgi:cobalt-zinc-cadmium efflux system membrane fusion protein